MFSQVRYRCEHLLTYGTGTVLYCTELRPLSCLYEYSTSTCTTVLQSYRTLLQSLFSVLLSDSCLVTRIDWITYGNKMGLLSDYKIWIILRARTSTSRGTVQLRSVRVLVRYCCAHLLNYYGTGTVPQCTVLMPLSCLYLYSYEYATVLYCTVRVPYCISNNIPRARTSTGTVSALPNCAGTVPYE